jgi:hypothetical protein
MGPGWELTSSAVMPAYTTDLTFGESHQALRLGIADGANTAGISAAGQNVVLPEGATSIVLSFRYYPLYDDPPGPGDVQYVDVYNAETSQLAGRALGDQRNDRTWLTTDYDLTAEAGQTVRLVFAVNNDGEEGRTAMYVDNVSVLACNFRNAVAPATVSTPVSTVAATPVMTATVTPSPSPAVSERNDAPRSAVAIELPAVRQPMADEGIDTRAWMARLGTVSMLLGVVGIIGFVALVIIGAVRARD